MGHQTQHTNHDPEQPRVHYVHNTCMHTLLFLPTVKDSLQHNNDDDDNKNTNKMK